MYISRRNFFKATSASLAALALSSCSSSDSSTAASTGSAEGGTTAASGDVIEIKMLSRWGDDTNRAVEFRNMVDTFNATHTDIVVVPEYITESATFNDKIITVFATGQDYHIYQAFGAIYDRTYVTNGLVLDLEPYMEEYPEWGESFPSMHLGKYQFPDWGPGTFAVPLERYCGALYYNKAIFAELGLEPPVTVEDFEHCCDVCLDNGVEPMPLGEYDNWRGGWVVNLFALSGNGASYVTDLANRTMTYDGPEMVAAFNRVKDYAERGYFGSSPINMSVVEERSNFLSGDTKVAMHMDQNAYTDDVNASDMTDDIGVVRFPYVNEAFKDSWIDSGSGYGIIKSDDDAVNDAAVQVLMHISGMDFFKNYYTSSSGALVPVTLPEEDIADIEVTPIFAEFVSNLVDQKEATDEAPVYDTVDGLLTVFRAEVEGLFVGKSGEDVGAAIAAEI